MEMKQEIKSGGRLLSLDVFRGLTIIGMILVNSAGNNTAYAWISHSKWNGCTLADLVFPFFVFIVGVAVVISLTKRIANGEPINKLCREIFRRFAIIFLLGLFLNAFGHYFYHFDFAIRVTGVLERIAICYLFAALLFVFTSIRIQALLFVIILIGYWALMNFVPVPGFGAGDLSPQGNLATYIDDMFISAAHRFRDINDPEGILSTLPAIATALLGNLTGVWLISQHSQKVKVLGMLVMGAIALVLGWIWGLWFPINKSLWTSSYVLWTGGWALWLLALFYWVIEIKNWRRWSKFFEIFGVNAIAAYFLHIFFLQIQSFVHFTNPDGTRTGLRTFLTQHLFGWASLQMASLLYAISYLLLWFVVLWILYRNKIFIKI